MKANKRVAPRRDISPLEVSNFSSLENMAKISRGGNIIEASTSGFLMIVRREDLIPAALRKNLSLEALHGMRVLLTLPQMNLEISGRVARTQLLGKQGYEIGIDYTEDSPDYWRECLIDLLPGPGELDEFDDV